MKATPHLSRTSRGAQSASRPKRKAKAVESKAQQALRLSLTGRSKRAIARKLGASPSHINRVLNGQRDCSIPLARRLADELGLPISSFLEAVTR